MAVCSHTGVTIPECSCNRCVEDQIRRNMPVLLDSVGGARVGPAQAPDIRVTQTGGRGFLGRLRRRPRTIT
jgi:hypothetical protein